MIRFGTNPIAWSNDDDRTLGAEIPLDQCLREAGEIGFDGIENGHKFPQNPKALSDVLEKNDLTLVSAWYSLELLVRSVEDQKRAIQPHLDLLNVMGCMVCIACETSNTIHGASSTPLSARPILEGSGWDDFGARVEEVAAFTAAQGPPLVYHHHMGTIVQTPDEIDRIMDATGPATRLLIDTGHCYFGGGDPASVLARHADRVGHFHAKNVRLGVFTVPGDPEGIVDFPACLSVLSDTGYAGWLVIEAEQDPVLRNPKTYQTMGLAALKTMSTAAGLAAAA